IHRANTHTEQPVLYLQSVLLCPSSYLLILRTPPRPTLFPYTTLFRSDRRSRHAQRARVDCQRIHVHERSESALCWRYESRSDRADRKSTRLNSSHRTISYAVFCLKKKNKKEDNVIIDLRIYLGALH